MSGVYTELRIHVFYSSSFPKIMGCNSQLPVGLSRTGEALHLPVGIHRPFGCSWPRTRDGYAGMDLPWCCFLNTGWTVGGGKLTMPVRFLEMRTCVRTRHHKRCLCCLSALPTLIIFKLHLNFGCPIYWGYFHLIIKSKCIFLFRVLNDW